MIDYWYNIFWNPWVRTTTTEKQKRDKVKVEQKSLPGYVDNNIKNKSRLKIKCLPILISDSMAYSHLCQTNVASYSIVGDWKPNGIQSRN